MDDDNGGQTGHHPFADNLVVLLIAMGSAAFVVSIYHLIAICFCNHHTTTDQDHHQQQQPPRATPSHNHGNSSSLVELIPAHKYHKKKIDDDDGDEGGNSTTCAVCLGDFEEGEELRTLPECMHSFHVSCIDMWLYSHTSCPICRASAAPSPAMVQHGPMPDLGSGDHHLNPHHSINMMQVALVQRGIV